MDFLSQICLICATSSDVNPAGCDSRAWLCAEEDPLGDAPPLVCGGASSLARRQRSPRGVSSESSACDEEEDPLGDDPLLTCGDALGEGGEDGDGERARLTGVGHDLKFLATQSRCSADMLADLPSWQALLYCSYQARIFPSSLSMLACRAAGGAYPPADERTVCLVRAIFAVCVGCVPVPTRRASLKYEIVRDKALVY